MKFEHSTYQKPLSMTGLGGGASSLVYAGSSVDLSKNYWFTRLSKSGSGSLYQGGQAVAIDNVTGSVFFGGANKISKTTHSATIGKLNIDGTLAWTRSLGGNTSGDEMIYGMACDSSGNVYAVGYCNNTSYTSGAIDILLCKYDTSGNLQWQRLLGNASGSPSETGYGIVIDSSDNIFLSAYGEHSVGTSNGAIVVKYNTSGTLQWNYNYADVWYRQFTNRGISVDGSGNIYFGGQHYDIYAGTDGFVGKVDSSGTFQWCQILQNTGSGSIQGQDVAVDSSGNVYTTGFQDKEPATASEDWYLSKFNSSGTLQWTRILGSAPSNVSYSGNDAAMAVAVTSTGDVVVGGHVKTGLSYVGTPSVYLIAKWNSSGTLQFQRNMYHNDLSGQSQYAYDMRLDSEDNIYFIGTSDEDIVVFKVPGDGSLTGTTYDSSDLAYQELNLSAANSNSTSITETAGSNFSATSRSLTTDSTTYTNTTSTFTSSSITLTADVSTIQ